MHQTWYEDVTLVIPAYDRPWCLLRVLDYYRTYAAGIRIIIADSGPDAAKEVHRKIVASFSDMNILYLGDYPYNTMLYMKLPDVLNHADTPYCVFCGDDDFITPRGIRDSVSFLDDNPDYTVAHGYYIAFRFDDKSSRFCWNACYPYESNASLDPVTRFLTHFANYSCATFYAVHRTDFVRMLLDETVRFTTTPRFGELLASLISVIHGRMKHLDVFYAARDNGAEVVDRRPEGIRSFVEDGTYAEQYRPFRDCLASHLSGAAHLSMQEACRTVDRGMQIFYGVNYVMRKDIKKLSIYEKLFAPGESVMQAFAEVLENPSSPYYEDFDIIRNHVLRDNEMAVQHGRCAGAAAGR